VYTKFFNLREEPFRLTPDPRFLHLAEPHRTALGVLLEGILARKGFLVLCGPIGTGKTLLMNSVLYLLEENTRVKDKLKTAFLINPTLSPQEFLEAVLDEFEVPCSSTSKPQRLAALHEMLLVSQQQGGTTVLVVDEAHLLTPDVLEEIRLLSNMDTYQEKLLQIVLSGQPELQMQLRYSNMRALHQRIAASCHLRPLTLLETRVYVRERLQIAGLQGDPPFDDTVLEKVFAYTRGVPRLTNLLCDSALSIGCSQQKRAMDSSIIDEAARMLDLLTERQEPANIVKLYDTQNFEREQRARAERLSETPPMQTLGDRLKDLNQLPWQLEACRETSRQRNSAAIEDIHTAVDLLIHAISRNRLSTEDGS
jgi:general secretion pathway protein A